jgi:carboxypeptidase PM20D1
MRMRKIISLVLAAFCIIAGIVLARVAGFASRQIQAPPAEKFNIDRNAIASRLSEAIQFKTVSYQESSESGAAEFARFHVFLASSFPAVHARLTKELVGAHSLLYTWKGRDEKLKPILLMGHIDVVPADSATEKSWSYPSFSGRIADSYIWGRGAMDDKVSVLGILEAAEYLLKNGFQPQRTIYFAFGHDEEIGGENGAAKIAELLRSRRIELDYVLDEGGNIVEGIIPDVIAPVALIGIAEKGYLSLELKIETPGGHASIPPAHTAIGTLSSAIDKLERSPFPSRLSQPVRQMFDFLGPEMPWPKRIALANLWLFDPFIRNQMAKSALTNAAIRTTQAVTVVNAGIKENVLPSNARAIVNVRILPGDTIAQVIDRIRQVIGNAEIKIAPLAIQSEPSPVSDTESDAFKLLHRTIRQVAPGVLVAPSLLVATTDSRHYAKLTRNIFRFLPITLGPDDARRFHGINERISLDDYERCVRFYAQLMQGDSNP